MSNFSQIPTPASKFSRIIRIYDNKCVINARACHVLHDVRKPFIKIYFKEEGDARGHVYIRPSCDDGFRVSTRKGRSSGFINSVYLCTELVRLLGSKGAYKVSETPETVSGHLCYQILPEKLIG